MLELALVHYNNLIATQLITDLVDPDSDPGAALHGFFDTLAQLKTSGPGRHGCLMVNTMIELSNADDAIRQQTLRYEHLLIHAFTTALERLSRTEPTGCDQQAHALLALAIAINLHARHGNPGAIATTVAATHSLLGAWGVPD